MTPSANPDKLNNRFAEREKGVQISITSSILDQFADSRMHDQVGS